MFMRDNVFKMQQELGTTLCKFIFTPDIATKHAKEGTYDGGVMSIHIQDDNTFKYQYFKQMAIDEEKILEQNPIGIICINGTVMLVTCKKAEALLANDLFAFYYENEDRVRIADELIIEKQITRIRFCIVTTNNVIMIESYNEITSDKVIEDGNLERIRYHESTNTMTHMKISDFCIKNLIA